MSLRNERGLVFRIEKYMIHDGSGIRTNIFLKGCPLTCLWCFNPEGIRPKPEILIFRDKCIKCQTCISVCPRNAVSYKEDRPYIKIDLCNVCGDCVTACPSGALEICGKSMTIAEVIEVAQKDEIFYRRSKGGITLTGGEIGAQPEFAINLLKALKGTYHTAIETSGCVSWPVLKQLVNYADQVFFDLKHLDATKHKRLTGVDNKRILNNFKKVSQMHQQVVPRIPIIPGLNDDIQNIGMTARFLKNLKTIPVVEILPYVNFGKSKYEMLEREYKIPQIKSAAAEDMLKIRDVIQKQGLSCRIVQ